MLVPIICLPCVLGSDNTAVILTLAIFFLIAQPRYFQRLRDELNRHSTKMDEPLDHNELGKVAFLDAIINETLRLGTMFFLPRVVQKNGIRVGETFIPEGTTIALAAYSQHISPDNFSPDPLVSDSYYYRGVDAPDLTQLPSELQTGKMAPRRSRARN